MTDFIKLRKLWSRTTPKTKELSDIYNYELLAKLNGLPTFESDGIQKITINDKDYLIYVKNLDVVAGVNCDDVEEYTQDKYTLSPYLNVLFRELGSDKIVRLGMDSESIHEDDIYSIYDSFSDYKKCYDWLINNRIDNQK
jgi:hypothetical protein